MNYSWRPYSTLLTLWLFFACCTLGAYLREYAQRERNLKIFGRFLDPRVVASLTNSETLDAARIGSSHEISVLFRSEEHTSELQSLMRSSYAVFCLKKKKNNTNTQHK